MTTSLVEIAWGTYQGSVFVDTDRPGVKEDVMVWAKTKDIRHDIRAVVRLAERLDMRPLGIWPHRCIQRRAAELT